MILINGIWFGVDFHCVLSEVGSFDIMVYGAVPEEVLAGDFSTTPIADDWEAQVNGCCGIRWFLLVVWAFLVWCGLMSTNCNWLTSIIASIPSCKTCSESF